MYMMDFEATILGHKPPVDEEDFDKKDAFLFARKIEEHSDFFDELFTDRNFHPAAAYPNLAPLVKASLLTTPYLVMQTMNDTESGTDFRREFSEYNEALRDAIRANPAMSKRALMAILRGGISWARMPEAYNHRSRTRLDRAITGASTEFAAEQLFTWAAENGQFAFEPSSVREDLDGIDFIISHPATSDPLLIDVKSSPEQVQDFGVINSTKPVYRIGMRERDISYKVLLYPGVNDALDRGQLRLDQASIEQKGRVISKTLQEIAETIHSKEEEEQPRLLAELALKFNSA